MPIQREIVKDELLENLLTPELRQRFVDAVNPAITSFADAHPLLAVSYKFMVSITDGEDIVKGGYEMRMKKKEAALRKYAQLTVSEGL